MAKYSIADDPNITDDCLRDYYQKAKETDSLFSYDNLDTIFEIALVNRTLFPSQNHVDEKNPYNYIERWVSDYRNAIKNPPHSHKANPKTTCSDPAIRKIVMATQGVSEEKAFEQEQAHNLFMSAENIQGNLLEEYIAKSIQPYGWSWCAGNTLKSIDFCNSDGTVLLQIKNKSNTENSSSNKVREGTTILKWYRLGTKTKKGVKFPKYRWDDLNNIINDPKNTSNESHLPPCKMTEDQYILFLIQAANTNHDLITDK